MSTIVITRHAVDRYLERIAPSARWEAARAALEVLAAGAAPVDVTRAGHAMWRADDVYLVMKTDGSKVICVTVLDATECDELTQELPPGTRAGDAWQRIEDTARHYDAEERRGVDADGDAWARAGEGAVLRRCICGRTVAPCDGDRVPRHAGRRGYCRGAGRTWSALPVCAVQRGD